MWIFNAEKLKSSYIILKLTITLCLEDGNLSFEPLIFFLILGEEKIMYTRFLNFGIVDLSSRNRSSIEAVG